MAGENAVKKQHSIMIITLDNFKKKLYNTGEYKQFRHRLSKLAAYSSYEKIKRLNGCLSCKLVRKRYVPCDRRNQLPILVISLLVKVKEHGWTKHILILYSDSERSKEEV